MEIRRFDIWQSAQYIGKIFEGIMPLADSRRNESVNHSSPLCPFFRTGEQVIFASQGDDSDGIFHEVVVNFHGTIMEVSF